MRRSDLILSLSRRLLLLLCFFVLGYALTTGLSLIAGKLITGNEAAYLRIITVIQDLIIFILPAIATACLVCRKPAELLALGREPSGVSLLCIAIILTVSIPAMESLIYWNAGLHFPASLADFEAAARQMEATASGLVETLLRSNTGIAGLVLNLMIIGIMAGFSEELLFRGCFQRLLTTGGVNKHVAVWTVAFVFSAFHFQIFGFVPRMLLGAYFGYLLIWTRSIWAPMLAHTLNNSIYVVAAWLQLQHNPGTPLSSDSAGELYPPAVIAISVAATAAALALMHSSNKKRFAKLQGNN